MEKAPSTRQLKVAREIQKVLAEIIRSKGMAAFGGALVTVSEVRVSPDLSVAKVFKRSMGTEKTYTLGDRTMRPEELSGLVLRSLKVNRVTVKVMVNRRMVTVMVKVSPRRNRNTVIAPMYIGPAVDGWDPQYIG